eukprot:m.169685 g.169685  ORF g.169685 m.169685 type:complete len:144 (-) comp31582_c1_seq1:2343-2774(-)
MLVKLISVLIGVCTTQVTGIAALSCGDVVDGVLTVPRFTTHIVDNALVGCNTLVRVDIDQTGLLYSIGNAAFKGCVNLEHIQIPNSVHHVATDAFHGCPKLDLVVPAAKFSVYTFLFDVGFIEKFPVKFAAEGDAFIQGSSRL